MKNLYKTKPLQLFHWLNLSLLITSGIFLSACASMEETADQDMKGEQQEVTSTPETKPASSESQSKVTATPYTMGNSPSTDPVNGDTAVKQNMTPSQPAEKIPPLTADNEEEDKLKVADIPPYVMTFCEQKPYVKYKNEIQAALENGWNATQEGKYGAGFRNEKEYKKWDLTQQQLIKNVFSACKLLAMCKSEYRKKGACGTEEKQFNAWQNTAQAFLEKVKTFESQQPPPLCGIKPNLDDETQCFEKLAQEISSTCQSSSCKELSQCWNSVAIMDEVINQAESSCRFAGQTLSQCRGYISAVNRRKSAFNRCEKQQNNVGLVFQPVL